jgi:hypothetical protein
MTLNLLPKNAYASSLEEITGKTFGYKMNY